MVGKGSAKVKKGSFRVVNTQHPLWAVKSSVSIDSGARKMAKVAGPSLKPGRLAGFAKILIKMVPYHFCIPPYQYHCILTKNG